MAYRSLAVATLFASSLTLGLSACGGAPGTQEETVVTDPLQTVSAQELYDRGIYLAGREDYVRAEQYFAASLQRGFDEQQVIPLLLAACVRSSRLSAALTYAEPYLDRHPDAWSLRLLVATIHMGLGATVAAQAELVRVTEDRPDDGTAHYMLAVIARDELGDTAAAEASFRRYLEIEPEGEHAAEAQSAVERRELEVTQGAAPRPVRLPSADSPSDSDDAAPSAPGQEATP
jgi:predicted Zn-dependent protease